MSSLLEKLPNYIVDLPMVGEISLTPYLAALIIFGILTLAFWVLQVVILGRLRTLSERTSTEFDDVAIAAVSSVRPAVYILVSVYVAIQTLTLPSLADKIVTAAFLFVIVWQVIDVVSTIIDFAARRFLAKDEDGDGVPDPGSENASNMVALLARIALWAFGGIFVLSNLGVEVTSLIAGLGIGGIAVAFALQGILSDLFSSFSIYFDKPFQVGDYIVLGNDSGTVEKIGIKSTRIRTLQGEELVVSNAELTTARVQNFKKMESRRTVFNFGVLYETPADKVKAIPDLIKAEIEKVADVRFDRAHFASYGDSALIFEVVFYVETSDYTTHMDRQQEINYGIMDSFAKEGIEFAYPTQTLYVKK